MRLASDMIFYLLAVACGGILLLLSLVGSGGEDDAGADAETETEVEVETESDCAEVEEGVTSLAAAALPFASIRFWTFVLAFGGLTGTLLTWLSGVSAGLVAVLAAGAGYTAGTAAVALTRWLGRTQVTSTLHRNDCVGATGTVVLPVARGERGRIRLQLEHQIIDLDAETDDAATLEDAALVVVYAVRPDGIALVTSTRDRRE